jgi:hypothetical protein
MALIAAAVLLSTGCAGGGSNGHTQPSQQDQVKEVANEFTAAFGSGDIKKACALFDPAVFKGLPPRFGCVGIYGGSSGFERSFLTATPERVVVSGNAATIGFSNGRIIRFKKVVGRWLVEDLGGASNSTG